jgi:hypothetical protein
MMTMGIAFLDGSSRLTFWTQPILVGLVSIKWFANLTVGAGLY